jgi:Helix-turn-helix domain
VTGTLKPGVAGFHAWVKAILDDDTLRKMASRDHWDIRLIAIAIASFGQNGRGCFATADTVAKLIGCGRGTVEKKRQTLIWLGWLTVVDRKGGANRRGLTVSISLPEAAEPW